MTDDIPDTGAVFTFGKSRFADNEPSHFFIKNDPIVAISCGDEHSAVICQNGRVFVFGGNAWGQLGLGHKDEVPRPSCVKWLKPHRAQFVACGRAHTVFVTDTNAIYTVGCNEDGQLGTGDTEHHSVPQYIELDCEDTHVKQISAGSNHTAVLTESGRVFVCGSNAEGQLGLGEGTRTCLKLTELKFMEKISFVECGYYHTVFITSKGGVFMTGDNESQKLGIPNTAPNIYVPEVLPTEVTVKGACCGASHTFLLSMDESKILGFGSNMHGQLGLAKDIENVTVPTEIDIDKMFDGFQLKLVACGAMHTAFVTDNGLLYTCGESRHNKLCLDDIDTDDTHADEIPNQYLPKRVTAMNGYIVDNVACGGCHTLLTATKGSNADFTNNDFSIVGEQARQTTITELPPLQKIPNTINKNIELPHTADDVTNSNVNELSDTNGNTAVGEDGSINSLEANVSGSNIMNINDLENDNGSIHDVPDLNQDDGDTLTQVKSEITATVNNINDMTDNAMNSMNNMAGDAIDNVNDMASNVINSSNDIAGKTINSMKDMAGNTMKTLEDSTKTVAETVENCLKNVSDQAEQKAEAVEDFILKKTVDLDPKCCDDRKILELPDNSDEITSTPPPKSPIIQDLLHVPDITQISADIVSDDGQKSESGSKSENETIPCGSDKSSPQTGKTLTAKTQAVIPIVRSEDMMDAMEQLRSEDKEVVVNKLADQGRFSRFFQSIRDKENSCMGKGKVIEETVQESIQKGIGTAEETVHKVEQTVQTEIRNETNSRTCNIL